MQPWRVQFDSKAGVYRHSTTGDFGHAFLAPIVGNAFGALGIAVTLWREGEWLPIQSESPGITRFETEHGLRPERDAYNQNHFARVQRHGKPSRGEHAGFSDLFVPVVVKGQVLATLVAGPFAVERPASSDVLERWRWLTGRRGHLADPEFAWYLRETLATLALDGEDVTSLERLLGCFARLMAEEGRPDDLANQAIVLRAKLEKARLVERTWDAVRTMIDDRSTQSWYTTASAHELRNLGLSRIADHVLVALIVDRSIEGDPIDQAIRRNAFQRDAVGLARDLEDAIAGQIGDHGIVLLSGASGTGRRQRQKVMVLADRASTLARKFALALHFGTSAASESTPVSESYHAALAAAENALTRGTRIVTAEPATPGHSLLDLRRELGRIEERPALFAARFERYLEAVAVHCGYRMEPAIAHLEVGFERMAESLLSGGSLEPKSFEAMRHALERAATSARSMNDLFAAYRRAIADVSDAVQRPVPARRDRSLQNAVDYIREHYTKPLRIDRVARAAGFTRSHFSRLFIAREGMAFEEYVARLRLERAQLLLADTSVSVSRVAELAGFNSPQYFSRVFRRWLGITPLEFRRAPGVAKRVRNEKPKRNAPKYKGETRPRR